MTDLTNRYVYALLRHNSSEPYYIGKGSGRRLLWHEAHYQNDANRHKGRIIAKEISQHGAVRKVKLMEHLTEEEAKVIEIAFIAELGRYPYGPLTNLTKGGDGGELDSAVKQKISAALTRYMRSEEARERSRIGAIRQWTDPTMREHLTRISTERNNPPSFAGHRHTDASRRKMGITRTGRHIHGEDTRGRMRQNALMQWSDPAAKAFRRARMLGSKPPKSHCPSGHELVAPNLFINTSGTRCCRECSRLKTQRYRLRRRMECQMQ